MRPRVLLSLLIGAGFAAASAYPAAAAAKATWEGVGLVAGFSELGEVQLLRYDLAARTWLVPISDPLLAPAFPLQIEVDASGIYARQTDRVIRIPHDGSGATTLWEGQAAQIGLSGPWLFVLQANVVRSVDKIDGSVAAERELPAGTFDFAVATAEQRLVFPGERDLLGVDFGDDGSLGPVVQPDAVGPRRSFPGLALFPDGRRVLAGREGHVYDARTLAYVGGVPIEGEDAAFGGGALFVAGREDVPNAIVAFSEDSLLEIGRVVGPLSLGTTLLAHGSDLFVFSPSQGGGKEVAIHPLSEFVLPEAAAPSDPAALVFEVRQVAVTRSEVAVVLPAETIWPPHLDGGPQLFRWSVPTRSFLPSLLLREAASHIVYEPRSDVLYVIHRSRRITLIEDPGGADPQEVDLGVVPFEPASAVWAGDRLLVASAHGWDGIFAISRAGLPLRVFDAPFELRPDVLAASEETGRVYLIDGIYGGEIASFLLDGRGLPEASVIGPGDVQTSIHALSPSPDGARVFDGAAIRDGATLEPIASFTGYANASAWEGDRLVIAAPTHGGMRLLALAPPFAQAGWELVVPGFSPGWLVPSGDGFLLAYYSRVSTVPTRRTHLAKIFPGDDLDGDGAPNALDAYLLDPTESSDRDGDGVGDNADAFPDDFTQHADRDGDRIADPLDEFPDDAELATAQIGMQVRVGVPPYGHLEGLLYARVHFFEDGGFLICPSPDACIPGSFQRKRGGQLALHLDQEVVDVFEATLEGELEAALSDFHGHPVDLALSFRDSRIRLKAAVSRKGKRLSVSLAFPYEAYTNDLGRGRLRGTFRIRGSADTMAR